MQLDAYLHLEETAADVMAVAWEKRAAPLLEALTTRLAAGDAAGALEAVNGFQPEFGGLKPRLQEVGVSSLLMGASRLVPVKQAVMMGRGGLPSQLSSSVRQTVAMLDRASDRVRQEAALVVQASRSDGSIAKAEVDPELVKALNAAVMGTGKAMVSIAANLSTSRLVSFGFLEQARVMGVASYQVSEVLDRRTCPVCAHMHGKVFSVAQAHAHLASVLATEDPEALKAMAPWPRQDAASLDQLRGLDAAGLQAKGWATPPYHPLCRGQLVKSGAVTVAAPASGPVLMGLPATLDGTVVVAPAPATLAERLASDVIDVTQGDWSTQTIESFRAAPNFVKPHDPALPLASSGGLPGSGFSMLKELEDPVALDFYVGYSLRNGDNKILGAMGAQPAKEYRTILGDPRFASGSQTELFFGVDASGMAALGDLKPEAEIRFPGSRYAGIDAKRVLNYAGAGEEAAEGAAGSLFHVTTPVGTRLVFAEVFDLPEAVFLPGSRFKVVSVTPKTVIVGPGKTRSIRYVELALVDDGTARTKELLALVDEIDQKISAQQASS